MGLKNPTYPYMWIGGVKNCQNHPYVINGWPLSAEIEVKFHSVNFIVILRP